MSGDTIVSTFEGNPATLQFGTGQLTPLLEEKLIGLTDGAHRVFELPAGEAFGMRNPELIQNISLEMLKQNSSIGEQYAVGDLVEFNAPNGGRFAGVLRELVEDGALFDFNHPLAGQTVRFEVKIIGIL